MRDHAKEVSIMTTKEGVASVPFWQHEYELWNKGRTQKRLTRAIVLTGVLALASNLLWARTYIKHIS